MRSRRLLFLFYVGPLVLWMVLIFLMSTDIGSPRNSQGLIVRFLHTLAPSFLMSLTKFQFLRLDFAVRKLGHFTEYMILAMLAVRALQFGRPSLKLSSFLGGLALSVGFAFSDELHQYFVSGRTASMRDVLIDSAGTAACMLLILAWFCAKGIERRLQERAAVEREEAERAEAILMERGPNPGPHPGRV